MTKNIFTHYAAGLRRRSDQRGVAGEFVVDPEAEHHDGVDIFLSSIQALNDEEIRVYLFYCGDHKHRFDKYASFLTLVPVKSVIAPKSSTHGVHSYSCHDSVPNMRVNVQRWFLYRNYIEQNVHMFNSDDVFFHCDSVDVVFQKNIFDEIQVRTRFNSKDIKYVGNDSILFFTECSEFTFINESFNRNWMVDLHNGFRDPLVQNIKHNNIVCTGTIYFGNLSLFIEFVSAFASYELICMSNNNIFRKNRYDKMGGVNDQGVINSLIYNYPQPSYTFIKNEEVDLIFAMALLPLAKRQHKIEIVDDVVTVDGKVPCVLHQYNRYDCDEAGINLVKWFSKSANIESRYEYLFK
tara:strand:- start:2572 stop:3624 length:1053 start_codon:yes stop_codon:yes gene_type:complete